MSKGIKPIQPSWWDHIDKESERGRAILAVSENINDILQQYWKLFHSCPPNEFELTYQGWRENIAKLAVDALESSGFVNLDESEE